MTGGADGGARSKRVDCFQAPTDRYQSFATPSFRREKLHFNFGGPDGWPDGRRTGTIGLVPAQVMRHGRLDAAWGQGVYKREFVEKLDLKITIFILKYKTFW